MSASPPSNGAVLTDAEVVEFFNRLRAVGLPDPYTRVDRAHDFIEVFSGESGARVLAQIAGFCRPTVSALNADKPGLLAFNDGQRYVLAQIMKCFDSQTKDVVIEEKPNVD